MSGTLAVSIGQYSEAGRKQTNQDFHGAIIPESGALNLKGIAVAIADGISSSPVGHLAAQSAVKSFLTDYYCTPDSWTVKTAAQRVITAANSWLHAQSRRSQYAYDQDKGYVCTLSVMVLKSRTAHLFHIGDSRIYRLAGASLEQLTEDHRVTVSSEQVYLGRALGVGANVEIDYRSLPLSVGDVFMLATDGVSEHADPGFAARAIGAPGADLDAAARDIAREALARGSGDNLTVQLVRIDSLPDGEAAELTGSIVDLPVPPPLEEGTEFDGYRIVRQLQASGRSHVYLAEDRDTAEPVVVKVPSVDMREDAGYLRRFVMEEWIGRRIDSVHVVRTHRTSRRPRWLYLATEYVAGQTLAQWMTDNPRPDLETVRNMVSQIARGLRAFQRREMVHQDLRPENIVIDPDGTLKIIDFGSVKVAGVLEAEPRLDRGDILGTTQYAAPEYFLGEPGTSQSDLYSLGVIAYQMLTGRLPYGAAVARTHLRAQQRRLSYLPATTLNPAVPAWVDAALRKAVHWDPARRYAAMSEFEYDLRHPNVALTEAAASARLIERDPVRFWRGVALVLLLALVAALGWAVLA